MNDAIKLIYDFVYGNFCQSKTTIDGFNPKELCPLIELFDNKYCQSQVQILSF